uniref:Family with sequence similarity 177 member B n=1 Tax=Salvator merianae TaxID=96440 RepID=A0A8D0B4Q3_SALMN
MEDGQTILKEEDDGRMQLGEESSKQDKMPRRVIYFASGESMEEYSTEEEDDTEENSNELLLNTANLSWVSFLRLWVVRVATSTFFTCDFLGGKLATFFGLTESKYQYAVDEYKRTQEKGSESDEESEETPETERSDAPNEMKHLQMESLSYGSIVSPENTVVNINELGDRACQSQNNF